MGHSTAAKLSEISNEYTTNDTENIHCVRITKTIQNPKLERMRGVYFEVEGKKGIGAKTTRLTATNQYDSFELKPEIFASLSRDQGVTFSGPIKRGLGKVGEYQWVTRWDRLGITKKGFTFKLETFCGEKVIFTRAALIGELIGY